MKGRKVIVGLLLVIMMISLSACGSSGADIVIKNGLVYTADGEGTTAEAVAIKDDEIVYVGDEDGLEELTGSKTKVIDMEGGMVLPGFIDSHQHPAGLAGSIFSLSLADCKSDEEYIEAIKKYYEENPDIETLVGGGWDRPMFDSVEQTKETLDEITTEIPIVLSDSGGHIKWLNSKALDMMGISKDSEVPEGAMVEKDADGEPTGVVSDYTGIGDKFSQYTCLLYTSILNWRITAVTCLP